MYVKLPQIYVPTTVVGMILCSGSRFVALFGEKMAGRQNLLQDPIPLRIIKVDMEDNKSGYGDNKSGYRDNKSGYRDNKSGYGDNKKDTESKKLRGR